MPVELLGYRYSVYSWIARLALAEKGVAYAWTEVDPFAADAPPEYLDIHPFKRVPALKHDAFTLYETGAITRYVDEGFAGPPLQPKDPRARARQNQIISIIDSYGYWPLVRQVFSLGVFRPRLGRTADETEYRKGLDAAPRVLGAVENLTGDGAFLVGGDISLTDIHLAPMMGYFAMARDGAALLAQHRRLRAWWARMGERPSVIETKPALPA